ncbi:anhydro-N-acetylmuramic acid kinase [Pseudothermotoga hypogea DSM 11164 = NBRC 106472]|uniref:Anhydro-N-acetylmuramic acid kinase n=1 Tax=Pseudothermotoga hypogea DSM 11164 = NBRC 106472 TaxID=1123384 RepID=A0A0X1KQI2_9THEM|nr:anhydro-N-acetylmuramic acid kinase [Pseudothermotoga hypogea]AJC73556.1 anhydro-N-acetylmuramic acid kinase [Pseudothermotoga hypogea DSM 11164 = NBRC 106472]
MNLFTKLGDWQRLLDTFEKKQHVVLGLMSGTSADGLDIAQVRFSWGKQLSFELMNAVTVNYEPTFREKIIKAYDKNSSNVEYVTLLNYEIARKHAEMVKSFNFQCDFVAYHGQTVWHAPTQGATLQLGEADVLAVELQKPVVHSLRTKDVALSGEGAPISAYFDWAFLIGSDASTAVLNIGGIANVTAINDRGELIAFDTGPGNCLIDIVVRNFLNRDFDEGGALSREGRVNNGLLQRMLEHERAYVERRPPKTTGREVYNMSFLEEIGATKMLHPKDLLRTVVTFTAIMVKENLAVHLPHVKRLIVTGGGAYNQTLIEDLSRLGFEVRIPEKKLIDFREAMAIAFLGELFVKGLAPSKTVTGARRSCVMGKLALPW